MGKLRFLSLLLAIMSMMGGIKFGWAIDEQKQVVSKSWDFESDAVNQPPAGFSFGRTGKGKVGHWVILEGKEDPNGSKVLAQTDDDSTDFRFPIAVADEPILKNVAVKLHCKAISGKVDQACGIVVRYLDENNYYLTRANALENNIRFYKVVQGHRKELASWTGEAERRIWHSYRITAVDDHFEIFWDDKLVLDVNDKTFSGPGKAGVWTKADSISYFDDLTVEEL